MRPPDFIQVPTAASLPLVSVEQQLVTRGDTGLPCDDGDDADHRAESGFLAAEILRGWNATFSPFNKSFERIKYFIIRQWDSLFQYIVEDT